MSSRNKDDFLFKKVIFIMIKSAFALSNEPSSPHFQNVVNNVVSGTEQEGNGPIDLRAAMAV